MDYEFTPNQVQALGELLKLVRYDNLAAEYYAMLPEDLRKDIKEESWRCAYTFAHTRYVCGNDTCRED